MDIMQAIIDIENKARGIVDSVDEIKKQNTAEMESEIAAEKKSLDLKLNAEKEKLKQKYDIIRETEMAKAERKFAERLEILEKKSQNGKERWAEEIVSAITGR